MTRQQPDRHTLVIPDASPEQQAPAFHGLSAGGSRIVDLEDAVTCHQLALNASGRSPQTMRLYLLYERRFLEYLSQRGISHDLDALSPVNVRQAVLWFQQRRIGTRGGAAATGMFLNVLKTWAGFLEQEGVYSDSPLRRVKRVKVRKLERQPYTRAEVNAILHACDVSRQPERDRLLVLLLLDTGARISELTGLHVGDMRMDTRTVRVLGKGNRERSIPVGSPTSSDGGPLFRALRSWLKVRAEMVRPHPERGGDRLLLTHNGYPLTAEGGTTVVKRLGEAAGVDGAIPHKFRHTAATHYLTMYPGDEVGLRRLLGHISTDVMQTYVHMSQSVVAERAGRASLSTSFLQDAR